MQNRVAPPSFAFFAASITSSSGISFDALSPVSKWADWLQYPQSSAQPPVLIDRSWLVWTRLAGWHFLCTDWAAKMRSANGAR